MFTRTLVLTTLLVSVAAASAYADAPIAPDPSITDTVTMRYAYDTGEQLNYTIDQDATIQSDVSGLTTTSMDMAMVMSVTEATTESYAISVAFPSATMSISMAGETIEVPGVADMLSTMTMSYDMDNRGDVSGISIGEGAPPEVAQLISSLSDSMQQTAIPLPEEAVTTGSTWSASPTMDLTSLGPDMETSVNVTYTIDGFVDHEGERLVVVRSEMTMTMGGTVDDPASGQSITMSMTGAGGGP